MNRSNQWLSQALQGVCAALLPLDHGQTSCHSIKSGLAATQSRVWAEMGHTVGPLCTLRMPPVQFAGLYR